MLRQLILLSVLCTPFAESGSVGVGYGLIGPIRISHDAGLGKLKDAGVKYLKGWNIATDWLAAVQRVYGDGNVGVTVAIPNSDMGKMASDAGYRGWVAQQLKRFDGVIDILAIGNEPSLNGVMQYVLPAAKAAKQMIREHGLQMRLTVPFMSGVLTDTYPPDRSRFSDRYVGQVKAILNVIDVFSINLYPYFAYAYGSDIPENVATGTGVFKNMVDGAKIALNKVGKGHMPMIVGETGWPTAGGKGASIENGRRYTASAVAYARAGPAERVYLFEAFDESGKPGDGVERNFGIIKQDGGHKFSYDIRS